MCWPSRAERPQPKKDFTTEATEITEQRRKEKLRINKLMNRNP
jgi:hypothetical protein